MKLIHTEITPITNHPLNIDVRNQSFLTSPFHAHPELELVFILNGFGKRIISNKVEAFESGDMVLVGPNVPHVWRSDASFYEEDSNLKSKVIVTYFNITILQQFFDGVKELNTIKKMIADSSRGIKIVGKTRDLIATKLITLSSKTGFEKVEGFLQIMHLLSICELEDKSFIISNETNDFSQINSDRLIDLIKFVKTNFDEHISLKQVAEIACMTEQSFCRFFKDRTKKSFFQYLEDTRMAHASKLLIESADKSISDIAYSCGYKSSSHFCKIFKNHYGNSPHQYRCGINKN